MKDDSKPGKTAETGAGTAPPAEPAAAVTADKDVDMS